MRDNIFKIIKMALLDYDENPAFISFRLLNYPAALSAKNKLVAAGFNANVLSLGGRHYIKINLPVISAPLKLSSSPLVFQN